MKNNSYVMRYIHNNVPGQQVFTETFEAESSEKAKEHADSREYVAMLLLLIERSEEEGTKCIYRYGSST